MLELIAQVRALLAIVNQNMQILIHDRELLDKLIKQLTTDLEKSLKEVERLTEENKKLLDLKLL